MSKIEGFILRLSLVQRRDVSEEVLVGTEIPGGGGGGVGGGEREGRLFPTLHCQHQNA